MGKTRDLDGKELEKISFHSNLKEGQCQTVFKLPSNCTQFHHTIVVLEKTFESPLDSKEIKPINPKGNQP